MLNFKTTRKQLTKFHRDPPPPQDPGSKLDVKVFRFIRLFGLPMLSFIYLQIPIISNRTTPI